MSRSLKKGPYVDQKLLARIEKLNETDEKQALKEENKHKAICAGVDIAEALPAILAAIN